MAIRDRDGMIADCRLHAQDDNTAGNALLDAQWQTLLNEVLQTFCSAFPEHFVIRDEAWAPTFSAGIADWTSATTANINVRRILGLQNTAAKLPMERYEVHRILAMLANDSTAGTATRYAILHKNESLTMTTKPNIFTVLVWPPQAGAASMYVSYEFYPVDLSASTDLPRGLGDAESRWIARIAAAKGAWLNGKDQAFVSNILQGVDQDVLSRMNVKAGLLGPRTRPKETVI